MSNTGAGVRAVYYARVSTQEEEQLKALPKQIDECKDAIKDKGWQLIDGYVDEGKSGTKTEGRKAYNKLLADMETDKFDILVVKSQDRLQRNVLDWYKFEDVLNNSGKKLYFYLDHKFYSSTEDALITGIKAILASEYSRDLSKKLNNANKRRIEKARAGEKVSAMGNSQMYGYRIVDGRWEIEPEEAKVVKRVFDLYDELHSLRKVRNALNEEGYRNKAGKLFTEEIIGRIIKNEKHKGWAILNRYHRVFGKKNNPIEELPEDEWVIIKDDHEPIVSEEQWDRVNDTIKSHLNKGHGNRGKRMGTDNLSGKLVCSCCGRVLWKHTTKGTYKAKNGERVSTYQAYSQWYCSGKMARGEMACEDPATISGVQLRKYLLELADTFLDYSTIEYSKNMLKEKSLGWLKSLKEQLSTPNDNSMIEAELEKLEAKRVRLKEGYLDGVFDKAEYMEEKQKIEYNINSKRALLVPVEDNPDIRAIDDTIANIDREIEELFMDEAMVEEKKIQFIEEHIKKIIVLGNKDVFIILDRVAGAFLFVDKGRATVQVVPKEKFNPDDLEEIGISEEDFIPFDSESMSQSNG